MKRPDNNTFSFSLLVEHLRDNCSFKYTTIIWFCLPTQNVVSSKTALPHLLQSKRRKCEERERFNGCAWTKIVLQQGSQMRPTIPSLFLVEASKSLNQTRSSVIMHVMIESNIVDNLEGGENFSRYREFVRWWYTQTQALNRFVEE